MEQKGFVITVANYLDDFLLMAYTVTECNKLMSQFLLLCNKVECPVSQEKTEWASSLMTILGMLLNGANFTLSIPQEKRIKATNVLQGVLAKKKVTVRMIQKLCWFLNFLNHAIIPGHTFTRCMYDKLRLRNKQGRMLKAYHHVNLDVGFRCDCEMWLMFLNQVSEQNICRPFTDLSAFEYADTLQFHTDAAKKAGCGMGAVFCNEWVTRIWNTNFLMEQDPSIEFLELYALTVGVLTWQSNLVNNRFIIFCDNQAVMGMVNNMTSKCPQCMKLIRILTRNGLQCNRSNLS